MQILISVCHFQDSTWQSMLGSHLLGQKLVCVEENNMIRGTRTALIPILIPILFEKQKVFLKEKQLINM